MITDIVYLLSIQSTRSTSITQHEIVTGTQCEFCGSIIFANVFVNMFFYDENKAKTKKP